MKRPTAVGANIFAGGFTLGVSKHFDVLAHLEHDDYGVAVARANFPNLKIFTSLDSWPEKANKKIDFLYANPPCAIWSMAGNRQDRQDWTKDPRLQRVRDIFALVERYRPAVWAWESVCQAFERGRPLVEELADQAAKFGYSASYVLIDAQYLGTPQVRKRFFLVLHRVEIDWEKFKPNYARPVMTAGEALKGVKPHPELLMKLPDQKGLCGGTIKKLLKVVKPGAHFKDTWEQITKNPRKNARGKILGRPSFLSKRIDPNKPVGVVFTDHTYHHTEPRHLSLNEVGALHGFPQTWNWVHLSHALTIQRGVLPPVGEWLAQTVAAAISTGKKISKPTRTLVDFRKPPGHIQEVMVLPAQIDLDWKPGKSKLVKMDYAEAEVKVIASASKKVQKQIKRGQPLDAAAHDQHTPAIKKRAVKESAVDYDRLPVPKPLLQLLPGVATSGELIRAAIKLAKFTDEEIAASVRKRFEGRTTSVSDVNWNRQQLKKKGETPPDRIRK